MICHVTFSEPFPNKWKNLKECLLSNYYNCMLQLLHKMLYDMRRKAYLLSQMINRSFQHTAFFLWPVDSSSSKDACPPSRALHGLPKLNLNLHPTTTLFRRLKRPVVHDLHSNPARFKVFAVMGGTR